MTITKSLQNKVFQLQKIIDETLRPLIDHNYYLLEVPYYTNIGDTLIWQGEIDFLKTTQQKCKGMYSLETYPNPNIKKSDLILFQGGGNFGDLWVKHHEFKKNIMKQYPQNKFIFFPQTVYYKNECNLKSDADFFSNYKNVTICARDKESFEILSSNFKNTILLVPDMAFFINKDELSVRANISPQKDLLLKRMDAEFKESDNLKKLEAQPNIYISDWKTMLSKYDFETKIIEKMKSKKICPRFLVDYYAFHFYRKHLIKSGKELLSSHRKIYTTRLHAAILGILLDKEVKMIDNSYGKNRHFFDSWLSDCNQVSFED